MSSIIQLKIPTRAEKSEAKESSKQKIKQISQLFTFFRQRQTKKNMKMRE
jgi:hypothetical protein